MTLRLSIGIDPGLSGAIAYLADGEPVAIEDMPTMQDGDWDTVDAGKLARAIRGHRILHPGAYVSAVIERVSARPGDGGTSAFRFGESSGKAKAVLDVLGIPYTLVTPASWKKTFGLLRQDDPKEASRKLALVRFPGMHSLLQRKKDHGRAEALLLALWHENEAGVSR